jgi:hypothetical protein
MQQQRLQLPLRILHLGMRDTTVHCGQTLTLPYSVKKRKRTEPIPRNTFPHVVEKASFFRSVVPSLV